MSDDIGNTKCFSLDSGKVVWEHSFFSDLGLDNNDYRFEAIKPIIYDVDNDGKYEVFVCFGYGFPYFFCLDAETGKTLWRYQSKHASTKFMSVPLVLDCNQDGKFEVIVATGGQGYYQDSIYVYAFDAAKGNLIWVTKYLGKGARYSIIRYCTFFGIPVFMVASRRQSFMYIVEGKSGFVIGEFHLPFLVNNIFTFDIDKDTMPEVIFSSYDSCLHVYEIKPLMINGVEHEVRLLNSIRDDSLLNWGYGTYLPELQPHWVYSSKGEFIFENVNDIDNDGFAEIIMISSPYGADKKLHVLKIIPE